MIDCVQLESRDLHIITSTVCFDSLIHHGYRELDYESEKVHLVFADVIL